MAYRSFRLRARHILSPIHTGPCALEDAVNDYIVRNIDLYDLEASVDVRYHCVLLQNVMYVCVDTVQLQAKGLVPCI